MRTTNSEKLNSNAVSQPFTSRVMRANIFTNIVNHRSPSSTSYNMRSVTTPLLKNTLHGGLRIVYNVEDCKEIRGARKSLIAYVDYIYWRLF